MAALDQRRGHDDGEKAGVAEQRAGVALRQVRLFETVKRRQTETGKGAQPGHRGDDPNQVFWRDHIDQ